MIRERVAEALHQRGRIELIDPANDWTNASGIHKAVCFDMAQAAIEAMLGWRMILAFIRLLIQHRLRRLNRHLRSSHWR